MKKLLLLTIYIISYLQLSSQTRTINFEKINSSVHKTIELIDHLNDNDYSTSFETLPYGTSWIRGSLSKPTAVNSIKLFSNQPLKAVYCFYSDLPFYSTNISLLMNSQSVHYLYVDSGNTYEELFINDNVHTVLLIDAETHSAINLNEIEINEFVSAPPMMAREICDDGIDNDNDGLVDCDDESCAVGYLDIVISSNTFCVDAMNAQQISIDGGMNYVPFTSMDGSYHCFEDMPEGQYPIKVKNLDHCDDDDVIITTRDPLSDLGQDVHDDILDDCVDSDNDYPCDDILQSGDAYVQLFKDGPEMYGKAKDLISAAVYEIDIAIYNIGFNSSNFQKIIEGIEVNGLSRTNKIPLRFLIGKEGNDGLIEDINDLLTYDIHSKFDVEFEDQGTADFNGNIHEKIIVVDGKKLLVLDGNPEENLDYPAAAWRGLGHYIEGESGVTAMHHIDYYLGNVPDRSWLDQVVTQSSNHNIMYAGRYQGPTDESPQNAAWTSIMENATSHVNVGTPNTGAQDFENLVASTVLRGVKVNILIPRAFNLVGNNWLGGGYDRESITEIREQIRDGDASKMDNLDIRFHTYDDVHEVIGNSNYAHHSKYMSADDEVVMFGSGNQDAYSWNWSDEQNYVVDNNQITSMLDQSYFYKDFDTGAQSYVEFYEKSDLDDLQNLVGIVNIVADGLTSFDDNIFSPDVNVNDEAQAAIFYNAKEGKKILLCDNGACSPEEDFVEIVIKKDFDYYELEKLNFSFEDEFMKYTVHNNGGGDISIGGKISAVSVFDYETPKFTFYNNVYGWGDVVAIYHDPGLETWFKVFDNSANDEAKSLKLENVGQGRRILLFNDSEAVLRKDYAEIIIKQEMDEYLIMNFEQDFDNEFAKLTHHGEDINGKISSMQVANTSSPSLLFYKGQSGSGDELVELFANNLPYNMVGNVNDEAESVRIKNYPAGSSVRIYDKSNFQTNDDYGTVNVLQNITSYVIPHFQNSYQDQFVNYIYCCGGNLNGKVSSVKPQ